MKKYFFSLLTLATLSITNTFAYDAIVIVLEAPLLQGPALDSTVVQLIRKGQKVYIPNEVVQEGMLPEFVPTFDRTGNRAYIPSKYVKVILGTSDEDRMPIAIVGHDPTDYRIEEPIPSTYPFDNRSFMRVSVAASLGNNTKSPYAYNASFKNQKYGAETGGRLTILNRVSFDATDRFYFGVIGFITTAKNNLEFNNNFNATESRDAIRLGPWLSYDAYKNEKYKLTIGSGFTFNYHRSAIMVDSPLIGEERLFSGYSLSPVASTTFQARSFLPNIDFVGGVDFTLFMPYTITSSDSPAYPELWAEDEIKSGLKPQASIFLGVQAFY